LAAEAIRQYIELNEWQIQEIKQTVAEADAARPEEWIPLRRSCEKYGRRAAENRERLLANGGLVAEGGERMRFLNSIQISALCVEP
jgi:hypothetical protein